MIEISAEHARSLILTAVEQFPIVLQQSGFFLENRFPEKVWNLMFKHAALGAPACKGEEWLNEGQKGQPTVTQTRNAG